jgi:hypothetical protein
MLWYSIGLYEPGPGPVDPFSLLCFSSFLSGFLSSFLAIIPPGNLVWSYLPGSCCRAEVHIASVIKFVFCSLEKD